LPVHDETTTFPPVEPFEFHDRGLDADKAKPNLLNHTGITLTRLTPRIGTEISGTQLSELSDAQKNELALLVAERGVVVFRDQDFKDIGTQKQKEFAQYFGRLHVHVGAIWSMFVTGLYGSELTDHFSRRELTSKAISSTTISTWEATICTVRKPTRPS
jgi:hypothetical protein